MYTSWNLLLKKRCYIERGSENEGSSTKETKMRQTTYSYTKTKIYVK